MSVAAANTDCRRKDARGRGSSRSSCKNQISSAASPARTSVAAPITRRVSPLLGIAARCALSLQLNCTPPHCPLRPPTPSYSIACSPPDNHCCQSIVVVALERKSQDASGTHCRQLPGVTDLWTDANRQICQDSRRYKLPLRPRLFSVSLSSTQSSSQSRSSHVANFEDSPKTGLPVVARYETNVFWVVTLLWVQSRLVECSVG